MDQPNIKPPVSGSPVSGSVPKPATGKEFKLTWPRLILYIVLFFVAYILARYLGILGLILVVAIVYLGLKTPQWYSKKVRNNKFPEVLAWLNIILWVFPPLGLYNGLATIAFAKKYPALKKKYLILGIIGLVCSVVNSVWGALGI